MHSQQMVSIAPILIGCIDYLAYETIFMRAMFRPKIKLDVLFPKKAVDACCRAGGGGGTIQFLATAPITFSEKC
jgi:hypothetical protein